MKNICFLITNTQRDVKYFKDSDKTRTSLAGTIVQTTRKYLGMLVFIHGNCREIIISIKMERLFNIDLLVYRKNNMFRRNPL